MTKPVMKAYMDKNDRLIIVIDQPEAGLTELVKMFLGGCIPEVQHLDVPAPMPAPEIDTTSMNEIVPTQQTTKPAKFIRNKEKPSPAFNGEVSGTTQAPYAESVQEKTEPVEMKKEEKVVPAPENIDATESNMQQVECMTVFELQDYLRSRSSDQKLIAILAEKLHTSLDFALHTKSEREIRTIALKLAN